MICFGQDFLYFQKHCLLLLTSLLGLFMNVFFLSVAHLYQIIFVFKHITFKQTFAVSQGIIAANQGHLFLKAVIKDLLESMGPTFVKSKWQESELQLKEWMNEDMVCYPQIDVSII